MDIEAPRVAAIALPTVWRLSRWKVKLRILGIFLMKKPLQPCGNSSHTNGSARNVPLRFTGHSEPRIAGTAAVMGGAKVDRTRTPLVHYFAHVRVRQGANFHRPCGSLLTSRRAFAIVSTGLKRPRGLLPGATCLFALPDFLTKGKILNSSLFRIYRSTPPVLNLLRDEHK